MRRTLSSPFTLLFKVLFPAFWSTVWGWGTVQVLRHPDTIVFNGVAGGAPRGTGVVLAALWLVGITLTLAFGRTLKRVRMIDDDLLISNYVSEVRVPIAAIREVREAPFWQSHCVILEFDIATRFGSSIRFLTREMQRRIGVESNVARELRELATAVRRGVRPS